MASRSRFEGLGPNVGLVEELYRQYLEDPASVGEGWREYFADYAPSAAPAPERAAPAPAPTGVLTTSAESSPVHSTAPPGRSR